MLRAIILAETVMKNRIRRFKGWLLKLYLIAHRCEVGKALKCTSWPHFRSVPNGNIRLGNLVTIGKNITLDVPSSGKLSLGNRVNLTQNIMISSAIQVSIGDNVLIAENVSIRDADHGTSKGSVIASQNMTKTPVVIENDVWIGASSLILQGARLKEGAIIACNSVVLSKSDIQPYTIYGGSPVSKLGCRQ